MCKQCELKPVYEFTNQRKLCKDCFVHWFQKKVLYTIRRFKMISKNDVVGYANAIDFREVVLEDVLKMFSEKAPVKLAPSHRDDLQGKRPQAYTASLRSRRENFSRSSEKFSQKTFTKGKEVNKIAIASTTDLEADKIIHFLINGKIKNLKNVLPVNNKVIKPLYLFLDKEVLLYAKLRNLKFEKTNVRLDKISKFIDELEKTHPEVKQAVVGSFLGC